MAEDQGKEEEKFEFTGEGEAVNYISLAQARLLAIRTARDPPVSMEPVPGDLDGLRSVVVRIHIHVRSEGILIRRREVKAQTLQWRQRYNRQRRESYNTATSP
jgi:hypothetical protein